MTRTQTSFLHELHPTQITVGMIEVKEKRHHLARMNPDAQRSFMAGHPVPVVSGPHGRLYLTDHHHLARAALEAGLREALVVIEADLSSLSAERFWDEMDGRGWVHPLDQNGVRHVYEAIPHHLDGLRDDVYRSLARYVRGAGGFEKTSSAFAEFVWADFFRRLIAIEALTSDFEATVKVGTRLALGEGARGMPGFRGK